MATQEAGSSARQRRAIRQPTLEADMPHDKFNSCIQACYACATACNHCAAACLREPDVRSMARCIALDVDCAEVCALAAATMSRSSECAKSICELCAKVCDECARECATHDMDHCRQCAEACRRCADECRNMVAAA